MVGSGALEGRKQDQRDTLESTDQQLLPLGPEAAALFPPSLRAHCC